MRNGEQILKMSPSGGARCQIIKVLVTFFVLSVTNYAKGSNTNLTNYEKQGISITYEKEENLPESGTLNGTDILLDDIPASIELNKTAAFLKCDAGVMDIRLTFKQPFFGIVYADFDRNSACRVSGNGKLEETIRLPLKGCGTLQRPLRVFTNNIAVRFHPGLEIDGDEFITIICRYPKPKPAPIPAPLQIAPLVPLPKVLQPLKELDILMIISAIIFLSFTLVGIACSYYCLRRRNIKVRRRPLSTLGSDITKISEPPSLFDGLKIPRARALDASGSDEVTESIKTDFASDIDSLVSEEEYTSTYSDKMCVLSEGAVRPILTDPPRPNFDTRVNVRNKEIIYTPSMSVISSDSELILNAQEQYLTTILERTETNTKETLERVRAATSKRGPPPVHARLNIKNKELTDQSDIESISELSRDGTEQFSEQEMELESKNLKGFVIDAKNKNMSNSFDVHIKHKKNLDSSYYQQNRDLLTSDSEYSTHDFNESRDYNDLIKQTTTMTSSVRSRKHDQTELITPVIVNRGPDQDAQMSSTFIKTFHHNMYPTSEVGGGEQQQNRYNNLNNFDVLIRIVDQPHNVSINEGDFDDLSSVFTEEERSTIKQVLMQDSTVQQELKSTFFRQDFLTLRDNEIIKESVQPQKWDVLIRVLSSPNTFRGTTNSTTLSSRSFGDDDIYRMRSSGVINPMFQNDYAISEGVSQGARSAADRSGAEMTEYHHYSSSTVTGHQSMLGFP